MHKAEASYFPVEIYMRSVKMKLLFMLCQMSSFFFCLSFQSLFCPLSQTLLYLCLIPIGTKIIITS